MNVVQYLKHLMFKTTFLRKDETPLTLQANVVYPIEGSCGKNQAYIGKTKRHLASRFTGNSYRKFSHFLTYIFLQRM